MRKSVLSISEGDYMIESGGVNKVIHDHQQQYNSWGVDYVFIYPLRMPRLSVNDCLGYWAVIYNGQFKGIKSKQEIILEIEQYQYSAIHIHHYYIPRLGEIEDMVTATQCDVYFILHDYHTVCKYYTFNKKCNIDISICDFERCLECEYATNQVVSVFKSHFQRLGERLHILAPSKEAKDNWILAFEEFHSKMILMPHCTPIGERKRKTCCEDKLRVAFVGTQIDYKGWPEFLEIVQSKENYPDCAFFQIGNGKVYDDGFKQIPIDYHKKGHTAIETLRNNNIDVGILFSGCKETYSFTYYECLAADVFVITSSQSGNISRMVRANNNGVVLENSEQLKDLLRNTNYLRELISEYQNRRLSIPGGYVVNNALRDCAGKDIYHLANNKRVDKEVASVFLSIIFRLYRLASRIMR